MNILDIHTYNFSIKLDWFVKNNLKQFKYEQIEWKIFLKKKCETTNNKIIVDEIKNYYKL